LLPELVNEDCHFALHARHCITGFILSTSLSWTCTEMLRDDLQEKFIFEIMTEMAGIL